MFSRLHFIFIICIISALNKTFSLEDGDLRLTEGNITTGWVEIYYQAQWNRVSDRYNMYYDIYTVICRQLGLPFTRAEKLENPMMPRPDQYTGNLKVWESIAFCDGHEERLVDCSNFLWSVGYHRHDLDVAVQCNGEYIPTGDLRLKDGSDQIRGRLEIFKGNHWDSLCSVGFGTTEATVACRQLGLLTNVSDPVVYPDAYHGHTMVRAKGPYIAHCNGDEDRIDVCNFYPSSRAGYGNNERSCSHSQDVGICCPQLGGECPIETTESSLEPPNRRQIKGAAIGSAAVLVLSIIGCCICCHAWCCITPKPKEQFSAVELRQPDPDDGNQWAAVTPGRNTEPHGYYHGTTPGNQDTPYQPGYNPTAAASVHYPPQETKGNPDNPLPPGHTATESPSAPPMDTSIGQDVTPSAPPPAYEHLIA